MPRHQVPALERYRAITTTNLGTGLLWDGELRSAAEALAEGEKSCGRWGLGLSELTAQGDLAVLAALHGHLPQARNMAELARATADQHGWVPEPQASAHMIALTIVACESGRLDEADHLIIRGTRGTNPDLACRIGFAALAVEVALARRDLPLAGRRAAALTDLASRPGRWPPLLAGWTRIVLAEHLLARHEVEAALVLLHQVPAAGYTSARRAVTLARCLLAQDDPAAALQLLTTFAPAWRGLPDGRGGRADRRGDGGATAAAGRPGPRTAHHRGRSGRRTRHHPTVPGRRRGGTPDAGPAPNTGGPTRRLHRRPAAGAARLGIRGPARTR